MRSTAHRISLVCNFSPNVSRGYLSPKPVTYPVCKDLCLGDIIFHYHRVLIWRIHIEQWDSVSLMIGWNMLQGLESPENSWLLQINWKSEFHPVEVITALLLLTITILEWIWRNWRNSRVGTWNHIRFVYKLYRTERGQCCQIYTHSSGDISRRKPTKKYS